MSILALLPKTFRETAKRCAATLLPRDCMLCATPSGDSLLCPSCHRALPRLTTERCPVCALPTPDSDICGACLTHAPRFDATAAVFRYEFPIDRLIQTLKYSHRLASTEFFGNELAQAARSIRPDVILPVPLAATRLVQRGFNQALEMARPLARALGMAPETASIRRRRDTAPQTGLPWKERARNVRDAFECQIDLAGKAVLVIDDVMTTGATLDELARTLKVHGAARVENLVLARALKDRTQL